MKRALPAVALAIAGLLLPAAGQAGSSASPTVISVVARDAGFSLSKKTAPAGPLDFRIRNAGRLPHGFAIAGKSTPSIKPGGSASLTVSIARAGTYAFRSTVPGDVARGLKGTLAVVAAKPAPSVAHTTVTVVFTGTQLAPTTETVSQTSAPVGNVTFLLVNQGDGARDLFFLPPLNDDSPVVLGGQTVAFTVDFTAPGQYAYSNTVGTAVPGVFTVTP